MQFLELQRGGGRAKGKLPIRVLTQETVYRLIVVFGTLIYAHRPSNNEIQVTHRT